jgi:hypothetical protein
MRALVKCAMKLKTSIDLITDNLVKMAASVSSERTSKRKYVRLISSMTQIMQNMISTARRPRKGKFSCRWLQEKCRFGRIPPHLSPTRPIVIICDFGPSPLFNQICCEPTEFRRRDIDLNCHFTDWMCIRVLFPTNALSSSDNSSDSSRDS